MSRSKILFFLSGSIAAIKAAQVISKLVQQGHEVQTVATPSALKFIGPAALEGLTGKKVLSDIWEEGHAMDHIHLTRWADFGVLCPASANTLAQIAQGLAPEIVSAMILAWPKTKALHIFPAMNHEMLSASPTQENLKRLGERGFTIHPTQTGNLACGEEGEGRLLEVEDILSRIQISKEKKGKILITAGATREAIDGIRYISNVSTGQTGAELCDALTQLGWEVTYVHGQGALQPAQAQRRIEFEGFQDLDQKLKSELDASEYKAIIQAAAISDYSVSEIVTNERTHKPAPELKLSSDSDLTLKLKRNHKILPRLKTYSRNKEVRVIGFKLTLNASEEEILSAAKKIWDESVDAVVANDWSQVNRDRLRHPGVLLRRNQEPLPFQSLSDLARTLGDEL